MSALLLYGVEGSRLVATQAKPELRIQDQHVLRSQQHNSDSSSAGAACFVEQTFINANDDDDDDDDEPSSSLMMVVIMLLTYAPELDRESGTDFAAERNA